MAGLRDDTLPYRLFRPEFLTTSVVFASPHSGRDYPAAMIAQSALDALRLRSSEDAFVDDLLDCAPRHGAALITARYPRAWVDLNRAEDELDPALIEGLPRAPRGPRVMAGLGVIPRVVAGNRQIYHGKITQAEADDRLTRVWRPYHAALTALLAEVRRQTGGAILLDMHSMPSEAIDQMGARRPDIVIGDRFGTSARAPTALAIERVFSGLGFRVGRNAPFAGAYIVQRYGRPQDRIEVVQVEINRGLYMDEERVRPSEDYPDFARAMACAVAQLAEIGRIEGGDALAAE